MRGVGGMQSKRAFSKFVIGTDNRMVTTKEEQARRKVIKQELRQKNRTEAEAKLPIDRPSLQKLFDYLDDRLAQDGCDHTLRKTQAFIQEKNLPEEAVIDWLAEYGGYCDCEVLANVE